jgi:hypothetical protein
MKQKLITLSAALLLASAPLHAQRTGFGIKGGLNISSVSNLGSSSSSTTNTSASSSTKIKLGGHVGAYAAIMFSDRIGFMPEIQFSMKGYNYESSWTIGSTSSKVVTKHTLNYINIPLQLKINFNESFGIMAGPYIGFLAGSKSTTESTSGSFSSTSTSTSTTGLTKTDIGLSLGLGIQQESGLNFGLKYEKGFNSISENDNDDPNTNSVFQLFIGFGF